MNEIIRQNSLLPQSSNLVIFVLSSIMLLIACNNDDLTNESFTIGDELVEPSTEIKYFDTLSVELSTVILDSVPTSNTNTLLLGSYNDGQFGSIQSKGFFAVAPLNSDFLEDDIYDSLTLVLNYSGYSYGDTTVEQNIKVYALTENIELCDDGNLYNTSNFKYSKTLLGQFRYKPKPSSDSIEFRISDELGKEFFSKAINGADEFVSETSFLDYFPGIVIETESEGNAAIIGFTATESDLHISIHYHRIAYELSALEAKIGLYDANYQFNQIHVDRSGTTLETWSNQRESIPASQTNNQVFVQGITGIFTRIEFPSLDKFIELGNNVSLLKAELFFEPIKNTYNDIELPTSTVLYQTDRINRVYDPIYTTDGSSVQQGELYVDYLFHENTRISFDLTTYFKYDFLDNYYDKNRGFLLGLNESVYNTTFDRIILGSLKNSSNKPRLEIYYILYK